MTYIREIIRKYPVLSKEEIPELCKRISKGDKEALHKFALSNCGLILKICNSMDMNEEDVFDMFQECFCEYLVKIKSYNPSKGAFSTYIYPWLKETIKKRNFTGMPISVQKDNKKVKQVQDYYSWNYHRLPTAAELSQETGLNGKRIKKLTYYNNFFYKDSLDRQLTGENGSEGCSLGELVPDNFYGSPEESSVTNDIIRHLYSYLNYLSARQKTVITLLYNLDSNYDHPLTLREVERETGIGRMTVSMERDRAIQQLRYYFEQDGLAEKKVS